MNHWELLKETADTLAYSEAPVLDFSELTIEELDELRARLHPIGQALALIKSASAAAIGEFLGAKGFVRFGDRVYRVSPDKTFRLKEDRASQFWELVDSTRSARRLFNANYSRLGGLRELGEEWADAETGELGWSAFQSFFFDVTEGQSKVTELPRDRAPKYIQEWPDRIVEKRD